MFARHQSRPSDRLFVSSDVIDAARDVLASVEKLTRGQHETHVSHVNHSHVFFTMRIPNTKHSTAKITTRSRQFPSPITTEIDPATNQNNTAKNPNTIRMRLPRIVISTISFMIFSLLQFTWISVVLDIPMTIFAAQPGFYFPAKYSLPLAQDRGSAPDDVLIPPAERWFKMMNLEVGVIG